MTPAAPRTARVRRWPSGYMRIELHDGTSWPHPDSTGASDELLAREMADAYRQLLTHPWGANVSADKVRWLHRALAKDSKLGGEK